MAWFSKWQGTPDRLKTDKGEAEFFAKTARARRVRKIGVGALKGDDPILVMMDHIMRDNGVSAARLAAVLGVETFEVTDIRNNKKLWRSMELVRRGLWVMGYDLQVKVKKREQPDVRVVATQGDVDYKVVDKLSGGTVGKWDKLKMWDWLEMDKLEK